MVEINNKTKTRIDLKFIESVTKKFLNFYKIKNKDVSIAFINDSEMKKLNEKYRHQNKATDVLSFDGEEGFFGEVVIDCAQIKRQAKEFKKGFNEELVFILVHGLLHLIGFDDRTEKSREKMIDKGNYFIKTKIKI
jgi:rRNA maturation RNase YbeY